LLTNDLRRIKLVVAYDGADFCGWAEQKDQRTVCRTLKDIVRQVSGEDVEIIGASRTDSGAHARHQVVHFDTTTKVPTDRFPRVLNKVLPQDLSVLSAQDVPMSFHSRFSARDRSYRYRILCGIRDPKESRYAHNHWCMPNVEAMHQAAQSLVGSHDFRAYSEEVEASANSVRALFSVNVKKSRNEVWIDICGNAFMRGMMRRISGGLLEVGLSKRPGSEIADLLDPGKRDHLQWPVVLPANGLCLMKITYGRHPKDCRERYQ
jgi:tRNA pseudouridine38-40 synthase